MSSRLPGGRLAGALSVTLLMAGAITAVSPAGALAGTCQSWIGGQPPSPDPSTNQLNAVTVLSPCNAWAVGSRDDQNVIEHFNGGSWKVVPSPKPGSGSFLDGVAAMSAADIWAVGGEFGPTGDIDLILHWNGHAWQRIPCPSPGQSPRLTAVRAVSANDIWAVGFIVAIARARTLILHWDGRTWAQVKSPNVSANGEFLGSMAATSASNAWVVGSYTDASDTQHPLILHWNGLAWTRMTSPRAGGFRSSVLEGVTATSSGSAWAVGSASNAADTKQNVVILHWNGSRWTAQRGPQPGTLSELFAVSASSPANVWAVGDFSDGSNPVRNLAFHCC